MSNDLRRNGCRPTDHPALGRRTLLQAGGLSLFGAGIADLKRLETMAAGVGSRARAKSVVFIFQSGGPSQHETFDPKPDAPDKVRGEYGTIQTKNPELFLCDHLPKLAQRADRYSIVRTMSHTADRQFRNEHHSAMYLLHTGTTTLPPGETSGTIAVPKSSQLEWPSIGSMLAYALPPLPGMGLPPVVDIPRIRINAMNFNISGLGPGMLGPKYNRWRVHLAPICQAPDPAGSCPNCFSHDQPDDPDRRPGTLPKSWYNDASCRNPDFTLPDLGTSQGASIERVSDRATLLRSLDTVRRDLEVHRNVRKYDASQTQAIELIVSQQGKKNPFDLSQESDAMRDQYGREEWGQAFLVARRLIESGVRMVQVNLRGWDTHQNAFRDLKGKLLPSLDHCLSGFLDDLHERGLLKETLIVMCGEMGRTPYVSPIVAGGLNAAGVPFTPGRHHWGDVFPAFFAGAGIATGQVVGRTDAYGGVPVGDGFTPSDLAATIFSILGIGPDEEFHDLGGRPFRIYQGQPIGPVMT